MKLALSKIVPNDDNPRTIKEKEFNELVESLIEFPEMAEARPIILNKNNLILGGNMRFKAMQHLEWNEAPVMVVDWSEEKQREFIIRDNISNGDWDYDVLANEWEQLKLEAWGLHIPEIEVESTNAPNLSIEEQYKVEVTCSNEEQQENLYNQLTNEGFDCRLLTL